MDTEDTTGRIVLKESLNLPDRRGSREASPMLAGRLSMLRYQVLVTAALFFGLFFVEYEPLFALGYWAWPYTVGYTAHKIISGLFILLNLGITQYAVRRWGFFQRPTKAGGAAETKPVELG